MRLFINFLNLYFSNYSGTRSSYLCSVSLKKDTHEKVVLFLNNINFYLKIQLYVFKHILLNIIHQFFINSGSVSSSVHYGF